MEFSIMLKKRRNELNLTQQNLADKLFVTRQTISRWENNISYPNLDMLVEVSNVLNLSLDKFLKGEESDMVNKLSNDVRLKRLYKKYAIVISSILFFLVVCLITLGFGRYTQNQTIDRINPLLTTQYGYGILPKNVKSESDTFISDDPFGNGEWLKFKTGQYTESNRWVIVAHKGSYVSDVRTINYNELPSTFKEQVGNKYYSYNKKAMGPRVSKEFNWLPFN